MPKPRLIFLLNSAQRHLQQWMSAQASQVATPPTPSQSGLLFVLDKADGANWHTPWTWKHPACLAWYNAPRPLAG
jgi:hypothetical protein